MSSILHSIEDRLNKTIANAIAEQGHQLLPKYLAKDLKMFEVTKKAPNILKSCPKSWWRQNLPQLNLKEHLRLKAISPPKSDQGWTETFSALVY